MAFVDQPGAPLHIGELARRAGVTSRTVRHYHATGLLAEPPRDAAGYRRYKDEDLDRLQEISRLRASGLPLDQVARALEQHTAPAGPRLAVLLERFTVVTQDQAGELAAALADVVPVPRDPVSTLDRPMMDQLLGTGLSAAQQACLDLMQSMLQNRAQLAGEHNEVPR